MFVRSILKKRKNSCGKVYADCPAGSDRLGYYVNAQEWTRRVKRNFQLEPLLAAAGCLLRNGRKHAANTLMVSLTFLPVLIQYHTVSWLMMCSSSVIYAALTVAQAQGSDVVALWKVGLLIVIQISPPWPREILWHVIEECGRLTRNFVWIVNFTSQAHMNVARWEENGVQSSLCRLEFPEIKIFFSYLVWRSSSVRMARKPHNLFVSSLQLFVEELLERTDRN